MKNINDKYNFLSGNKCKITISTLICFNMLLTGCNLGYMTDNDIHNSVIQSEEQNVIIPQDILNQYESIDNYDNKIASVVHTISNFNFELNQDNYVYVSNYLSNYENNKSDITLANGFGYDSTYFREGITSLYNSAYADVYGLQENLLYVDDLNYMNTTFPLTPVNSSVINSWIVPYSNTTSTEILRAVLASLNLRPYIDEIPSQYMEEVFSDYYNMDKNELFNLLIEFENTGNVTLKDRILIFYTLYSYNQNIHSLVGNTATNNFTGEEHTIRLCRNNSGTLMIDLDPNDDLYRNIIYRFRTISEPLNTESYIDPSTGSIIEVIVSDTLESYREAYNCDYSGILNYARVPQEFTITDNILNIRGL